MRYYIGVIHKDPDSDYGVTVPDLPGCFSAGSTIDEAMAMAREAIELHVEGLGSDFPGYIVDRDDAGRLLPAAAALNRTVFIEFTAPVVCG